MIKNLSKVAREKVLENLSSPLSSNLPNFSSFSKNRYVKVASDLYRHCRLDTKDISEAIKENQEREVSFHRFFPFWRVFRDSYPFRAYYNFLSRPEVVRVYTEEIVYNSRILS